MIETTELRSFVSSKPSIQRAIENETERLRRSIQEERQIESAIYAKMPGLKITMEITGRSIQRVALGQMVSDEVMEAMFVELKGTLTDEKQSEIEVMSPQLFERLRSLNSKKQALEWVQKGTNQYNKQEKEIKELQETIIYTTHPRRFNDDGSKNINIFNKAFVFIPIYYAVHFSLVILVNLGSLFDKENSKLPLLIHLDSLPGHHDMDETSSIVREWVQMVYPVQKRFERIFVLEPFECTKFTLPAVCPSVDYQDNGVDCGIYVLFFFQLVLWRWPNEPTLSDIHDGMKKYFKSSQFTDDDMVSMRIYILSTFINHAVVDTIQPKLMDVQSLVGDKIDAGFIVTYENMKSCHQVHRPIEKEDIDGTDDDVVIVVKKRSKVIVVK